MLLTTLVSIFFIYTHSRPTCSTRSVSDNTRLEQVRVHHERSKAALKFWGPKLWNSIPVNIRSCIHVSLFATAYDSYLELIMLSNYDFDSSRLTFI